MRKQFIKLETLVPSRLLAITRLNSIYIIFFFLCIYRLITSKNVLVNKNDKKRI